ncbi:hypothetical protein OAU87_02910 [Alphaproteobacteria bacterium]|nr:FAD-binding domain-containing protein [Alphaproteobacteria bacterium]MDC3270164.1 hypothetical protein [Alphaproteobacteria bacterium]
MFQSSLKEAQAFQEFYLPNSGSYYRDNRNYSYDLTNNRNTTSLLSPYIRYRLLSEEDVIKKTLTINSFTKTEKFIQEIYWRTYWKGWLEHRPDVYDDYLTERNELLKNLSNTSNYQKAINGETHLSFFNDWIKKLKVDGYLHNHVRMWFASIWIFTLDLPWQLGANFFMEKLLDGDPASNTLSWRWVAGIQTKGKHYLARKNNIIKYGNIEINDNTKLNEQAVCLEESKSYFAKDLVFDNSKTDSLNSILIPTEDLNFILNNEFQFKNIFSGVPFNDYNDHNFSQKVKDHIKKITISNFKDNNFYKDYEYIIEFENYYGKFTNWANKKNIKKVGLPYVTKGNWNKIYQKLISDNPSINFVYLYRKYDMQAWQFAKKGFFNFKKHIPELISKL